MKIVIAPSKTMKYQEHGFISTPLIYPEETNYLKMKLKEYNDEELCELMKISYKQATKVYDYYHETYPVHPALSLYQGTVFKQLDLSHFQEHLQYLDKHLCIMSAYYGVLKYNTGITPYRLDMTMKLDSVNLYEYWYTPIYRYFENEDLIISLASQEFTSMIHHPHLYFIDFVEIKNEKIKRNAMIIKKARGQMLNQMILNEIHTLDDLKNLNIDGFIYDESQSHEHNLVFIRKSMNKI